MTMIFGVPIQALLGQLLVGLINGSFYALLSLGLAVIFGLLRVINFAHGAQYMLGAFVAFLGLQYFGINFWVALIVTPFVVALFGAIVERFLLSRLYDLDPLYGLLFTFGLALVVEGTFEASMVHSTELSISQGGVFKGEIEVEEAEIAGTIDGTLTARASLIVRSSGKVLGTARCRRLQVEDGGQITGRIEMITDQTPSDLPPRPVMETVA